MSDINQTPEKPKEIPAPSEKINPRGIAAMQGEAAPPSAPQAPVEAPAAQPVDAGKPPVEGYMPAKPAGDGKDVPKEAPREPYLLPDGRPANITGDLQRFKGLNHDQGEVPGFKGTCGICSTQCVLGEHGIQKTEKQVLDQARGHVPPLCVTDSSDPGKQGGTNPYYCAKILTEMNSLPSHVEKGKNFQDLSNYIDDGRSVILSTNAGYLWNSSNPDHYRVGPSKTNHAVTLVDVAHDPKSDAVTGFFINDSGNFDQGKGSGKFVDLPTMEKAWLKPGGTCVVSDKKHR